MSYISRAGVEEITGWEKSFDEKFGSVHEDRPMPSGLETADKIKRFIRDTIASAVEAERAKWVFASDGVRKTMTELFLQDKQNEQINPSKK